MRKNYSFVDNKLVQVDCESALISLYINPDEKEKKHLIETLKLDEHTLHSALDPDELSRLEFEPEHVAVIFKRPKSYSAEDQFLFKVESTGAYLFKDHLVIVIREDVPIFDGMQLTKARSPAYFLLRLINRSIFHFLEHLRIIHTISGELQNKISTAMENVQLLNLFELQKSLVYYLDSINSNGVLIERLKTNATKIGFNVEEMELLDDIYIENNQCYKQAEIYSNILASLMDARVSIVSNNLNVLIKFLNIITIAIMVPTFVVSAFSMNVGLPLQSHPHAFMIVMGFAISSVIAFMFYWRHKKW